MAVHARPQLVDLEVDELRPEPIAITSYVYNVPDADGAWNYAFEAENGIKQEARGEMRRVEDVDVVVMRGSYSYIGPGGGLKIKVLTAACVDPRGRSHCF